MSASVAVLGATGSVGTSALDVIGRHPDKFRVTALTANANFEAMRAQCAAFSPDCAVMAEPAAAKQLQNDLAAGGTQVRGGAEALCEAAAAADIVVCGIVGAAGLRPTLAAVRAGKKVLIANKEPLVMLGAHIMREARAHGASVIPLDSEHNAIFQCLPDGGAKINGGGARQAGVAKIWLTGSGGPFRKLPPDEFAKVTPAQARAHPTWEMGPKISVDSATMMNKGLELIEACALFSLDADDVEIVVHPQSVIHSMVEYVDGSILAQLGSPDMRVPIAGALGWPRRIDSGARRLNLLECARFDFEAPDLARFPCIGLARAAARDGGVMPAAMNAANEIAVAEFLKGALTFDKIPRVVEGVMERTEAGRGCDLESALAADARARKLGAELAAA
ncbi:MAG: 1-deoxy-D-xylulose-5-phosphate reductoisomerase [Gammaproteobacteria bacterium]|nr:1-deoxy-D-xylulose-5-phosphate reductoisomerase [Gammaproteobacteria bacterium]CAJ2376624.1 MAG: 1-deoxy-D-xylulose 5-phosphate reductoisomerase [Arenicellales bacterium IbO2]MDA7969918.1 1-deoxy-D-xylulose-5-phosphate reductoisomerase [Gammaproteobacteria bacterium]MDA7972008.1 1-deoxy-D-xylulose-5-phosphate reductoisomerase [Gammaproteobacteria bacterium]MDA7994925.1 1-deoxy-D-xylulose-5-phosphate reductoisomerase [Gammaproteobacteria bacterium]